MTDVEAQLQRLDGQPVVQVFTGSGTWNKPAGCKYVRVRVVGGGGAGGGSQATVAGQQSLGGGGGSGGAAESIIGAGTLAATVAVTVGAAGTGVSAGTGGSGGTSSFGTHVIATGGIGGSAMTPTNQFGWGAEGAPGAGTAGDILVTGNAGTRGICMANLGESSRIPSLGGGSPLGGGGGQGSYQGGGGGLGANGTTRGAGGAGSTAYGAGGINRAGGNGVAGQVIVEAYFA